MSNGICSLDGCGAPHFARGICEKHYTRFKRAGIPLPPKLRQGGLCWVSGCEGEVYGWGLCSPHYQRQRVHGDPLGGGVKRVSREGPCLVEDCDRPIESRGFCKSHYRNYRNTGDPLLTLREQNRVSVDERFWSKVDKSGGPNACWPWTASTQGSGYGAFRLDGRHRNANRVALELHLGRLLAEEEHACHTCDNPPCCNPNHLYVGNAFTNMQDKVRRGRWRGRRPRTAGTGGS